MRVALALGMVGIGDPVASWQRTEEQINISDSV